MRKLIISFLVFLSTIGGVWYFNIPFASPASNFIYPTSTPLSTQVPKRDKVLLDVPFVAQAPTGKWSDSKQQDGCEEAAAWMAVTWARGETRASDLKAQEAKIIEISDWEEEKYGSYHDTSVEDTVLRIFKGYLKFDKARVSKDVTVDSIKEELAKGNLIQIPADGRVLANPNYTAPGPERHNLIIKGYDDKTGEFITNDNGTRKGKDYRYKYDLMLSAIRDYPTGNHVPIKGERKVMIVISK